LEFLNPLAFGTIKKKLNVTESENIQPSTNIKSMKKSSNITEASEIEHLKQVIKDLTSDENKKLLEKSSLKKLGFPLREFYDNYIYIERGNKPIIEWTDNSVLNKIIFQQTLGRLERENNLTKLFYDTPEWNIRKTEVLERDKDRCRICGSPSNGVHHRVSATYNPDREQWVVS